MTPIYWGARIQGLSPDSANAAYSDAAWAEFESAAGKEISWLQFSDQSGSSVVWDASSVTGGKIHDAFHRIVAHQAAIHYESYCGGFTITDVANGKADARFKAWATALKNLGQPFIYRFGWEMNGSWTDRAGTPDCLIYSRPADFVKAWRRLWNIAQQVGAKNITWLWNPNWWIPGGNAKDPTPWFPGAGYVDWVGLQKYSDSSHFPYRLNECLALLEKLAPGKPVSVETGTQEAGVAGMHKLPSGTTKAAWTAEMFATVKAHPQIKVLQWWNDQQLDPGIWIESSPAALASFRKGIADPYFAASAPTSWAGGKVAPHA